VGLGWLGVLAVLLGGCAGSPTRTYVHPEADFEAYDRVAVLPFGNLTDEEYAGARVTDLFVTEFLIISDMEIVEPNLALSALLSLGEAVRPDDDLALGLPLETLRALAEEVDAQAVLVGTVDDYTEVRIGAETFPVVAISVRLLDAETGTVIWRAAKQARGGPTTPFIGVSESYTRIELAQKMCQEIVESMEEKIRWAAKQGR
jgi:TolB-like protein